MRAFIAMVCVELLVAMTGLRSIAEASAEGRTGFLRVESRTKVSGKKDKWRLFRGRCPPSSTNDFRSGDANGLANGLASDSIGFFRYREEPAGTITLADRIASSCSNGFAGIQTDNVCCELQCGQCGGMGCEDASGGAESCCTTRILNVGSSCDDVLGAPCYIPEDEPTPSPTSSTCSNGFIGIQTDNVCCDVDCGLCGGIGCEDAPGGADNCCTARILNVGSSCENVYSAPCFIPEDDPTPSPVESMCSNGFIGIQTDNVCCDVDCGLCGGMGCDDAPGGADNCCTARILNVGSSCENVYSAPCFIPEDDPTPSPVESMCSNGFIGIQTDNVCCDVDCGLCGGMGCDDAPGGADNCCTARILNVGSSCENVYSAPCFIPEDDPTPSPVESMCSNGFIGIQTDNVCCDVDCGLCGGMGCDDAPGGADNCCTARILNVGSSCENVYSAPCFIPDDDPTPSPVESMCSNGFIGIQTDNVCCDVDCGLCGGMGCDDAPGGADNCCTARILNVGSSCDDVSEAPCFMGVDEPTPSPTESMCSNGFIGIQTDNVCCDVDCGLCGGMDCGDAPGGADNCCTARISNVGSSCDDVSEAPCFMGVDEPTPSPTESMCSNGFIGIQTDNVCCDVDCGLCGGMDCGDAPGGADNCCTARISNVGSSCDDVTEAPCFIEEDEPTPSPASSTCNNGFPGIQSQNVCCALECGLCGGMGCSDAPGGADSCCTARISSVGSPCMETGAAPCFMPEKAPKR